MSTLSRTREVPGTPEQVSDLVSDLARWPEWFALNKGWVGEPPTQAEVGTTFKHKVRVLGVPGDVTWTVVEADPPRRFVLKGKGPSRTSMEVEFEIAAAPGGSLLTFEAKINGLVLRAVGKQLDAWLAIRADRSLDALSALL